MGDYQLDTGMFLYFDIDGKIPTILQHRLPNKARGDTITSKINQTGFRRWQTLEEGLRNHQSMWIFYDSLSLFGHSIPDCIISLQRVDGIEESWSNDLITLNYIRQFEQMYLDTCERVIYLKPWPKT
jgi:hypothetical protein